MKREDLVGKKFGRLTVLSFDRSEGGYSFWRCICECGNEKVVRAGNLRQGTVKSCGCLAKEAQLKRGLTSGIGDKTRKHGGFGTKLYGVWASMIRRCENKNQKYYPDYGGRGIKVCQEWRNDFASFRDWANESGYCEGLTIDRIDVNGDYEPSNCRWVTMSVQSLNKRNSVKVEYEGRLYSLSQLIKKFNLKPSTTYLWYHKGMSFEEILLRSK